MFPAPRQRWVEAMTTLEEELRALPHRTFIVHGREDRVIHVSTLYQLEELLPNADLSVFSECGHWSMIERTADVNRQVGLRLERLKGVGRLDAEEDGRGLSRRTPCTVTAPGLLRQQLARVAEAGVAFEHEESAAGVTCIAAPVLDAHDHPLAAVSVMGPSTTFAANRHETAVKAAASGGAATWLVARRCAESRPTSLRRVPASGTRRQTGGTSLPHSGPTRRRGGRR